MIGIQTILSGFLIMRLAHVSIADCDWVQVANETSGDSGTNEWRYLNFAVYDTYDASEILFYKLEYGSSGASIVFSLDDATKQILEDSVDLSGGDQSIDITVISSDSSIVGTGSQYFCKACSSSETSTRYGDTCWGILPVSDGYRSCGCNSGGWTGNGLYYGGYSSCNVCACWGGAFAGEKTSGVQKGRVSSVGAIWSVCVEQDLCADVDCDDGDLCTDEYCDESTGECVYSDVNCTDSDACTIDSCDSDLGCINEDMDCANGNICDGEEACIEGECVSPNDFECATNFLCNEDAQECLRDCTTFAIDGYLTDCSVEFDSHASLLEEITDALTSLASSVSSIAARVSTNEEDIETGAALLSTLTTEVSGIADDVATNIESITAIEEVIATNTASIATNADNIDVNAGGIATNLESISTNSESISSNTESIATNSDNIASNTDDIASNEASFATNTDAIAANEESDASVEERLAALEERVYGFEPDTELGENDENSVNDDTNTSSDMTYCYGHYGDGGDEDTLQDEDVEWCCSSCNCKDMDDAEDCEGTDTETDVIYCYGHYGTNTDITTGILQDEDLEWCCSDCNCRDYINDAEDCPSSSASTFGDFDLAKFSTKYNGELMVFLVTMNVMLMIALVILGVCYCRSDATKRYAPVQMYASTDDESIIKQ